MIVTEEVSFSSTLISSSVAMLAFSSPLAVMVMSQLALRRPLLAAIDPLPFFRTGLEGRDKTRLSYKLLQVSTTTHDLTFAFGADCKVGCPFACRIGAWHDWEHAHL
jgi:hypothetical protein